MEKWQGLAPELKRKYYVVRVIKRTNAKELVLLQNTETGKRLLLRNYPGKMLPVYSFLAGKKLEHIPQIYLAKQLDGRYYVLEEFIDGSPLSVACPTKADILEIIHQLCQALSALHSFRIVHRDVKPDNILQTDSGKIYLIDLDAARICKSNVTQDTSNLGTAGYAAPEQFGIIQTDHRADIFALGITFNVLLTGAHPSQKLCHGYYRWIILKCTRIDPNARYQNVDDVWAAVSFKGFLPFFQKHKTSLLIGLAVFILLLTILSFILNYNNWNSENTNGILMHSVPVPTDPEIVDYKTEHLACTEQVPATSSTLPDPIPPVPGPTLPVDPPKHNNPPSTHPETSPQPTEVLPDPTPAVSDPTIPSDPPDSDALPATHPETIPQPTEHHAPPEGTPPADALEPSQKSEWEIWSESDECKQALAHLESCSNEYRIARDRYNEWLNQPYALKDKEYENQYNKSFNAYVSKCAATAQAKDQLQSLQSQEPPDQEAIAQAQAAYEQALAEESQAYNYYSQCGNELQQYRSTPEYLTGYAEQQRRFDAMIAAQKAALQAQEDFETLARPHGFH